MKRFLIPFIILGAVFGVGCFFFLKNFSPFLSPNEVSLKNLSLFFFLLGGFIWILASLIIYFTRLIFFKPKKQREILRDSLRLGVWMSFLGIFLLFFQLAKIFHPINILFLAGFILMIELYFRTRKK